MRHKSKDEKFELAEFPFSFITFLESKNIYLSSSLRELRVKIRKPQYKGGEWGNTNFLLPLANKFNMKIYLFDAENRLKLSVFGDNSEREIFLGMDASKVHYIAFLLKDYDLANLESIFSISCIAIEKERIEIENELAKNDRNERNTSNEEKAKSTKLKSTKTRKATINDFEAVEEDNSAIYNYYK